MRLKKQVSYNFLITFILLIISVQNSFAQNSIELVKEIRGSISPKSIVYSGNGIFSAQNMMYRHTVTLYTAEGELISTINDNSDLKSYGFDEYKSDSYLGGPVEACFSDEGKYLWVSNYSMVGKEFSREGCDACIGDKYDPSFIYKINTETQVIENVIKVGAVPKYLAINEATQKMVVTNWTSSDVSIIDLKIEKEIKRIKVGSHPRGVDITKDGSMAYVTIMGSTKIATINMNNYELDYITDVGRSPRHLILDENDNFLFCSVNSSNKIVRIDLKSNERMTCSTKSGPRTMVLSDNQRYLYVVNYFTDSFQKIDAKTMSVVETVNTGHHPIGITGNWETSEIWVACYEGRIQIFKDSYLDNENSRPSDLLVDNTSELTSEPIIAEKVKEKEFSVPAEELIIVEDSVLEPLKIKGVPNYKSAINIENKKEILAKRPIEIETNSPNYKKSTLSKTNSSTCKYHIIIGSFGVKANAEKLKNEMNKKGYSAQLLPSSNHKMTMVSIQCFDSESNANVSMDKILQESKQSGWVYGL